MEKIDFNMVLKSAASIPTVRIDRASFLKTELSKVYDEKVVSCAIERNPVAAGISKEEISNIAKKCINYETTKVTTLSALSGIPGGFAMVGTIPADLTQYFGHILRILQKLIYLYGWEELFDKDELDDETSNILTLFVGVMFGVNGAAATLTKISASAAQRASKSIAQKALTKGAIYPVVKKIAQIIGVKMTKEIFAKGVSKAIPVLGAVGSGTLTYVTYKPMAFKLQKYLSTLKWADVEYYKNNESHTEDSLVVDEKEIIETLDIELNENDNEDDYIEIVP